MGLALKNIRIARVSTVPFFVFTQLRSQLEALASNGAEVCIITSNDELGNVQKIKGCSFKPVSILREISFLSDLNALFKLWLLFRKERFDIVHSTTPKAGLLCAIAAKLAGVPICVHTFTGQAWVTMTGLKKWLVQWSDRIIAQLNSMCYADSFSQKEFLVSNRIVSSDKIKVIGNGSLAGVDIARFSSHFSEEEKIKLKAALKIDQSAKILLFVGRVTREKGFFELLEAVKHIIQHGHNIVLIVIGPFEQQNENEVRVIAEQYCGDRVRFMGFQKDPESYMAITDLLCLPSYREGFGTVVIEAGAMQVPVVGTNIYGLTDAIVNGKTGILVEPRNAIQLANAIEKLITDDAFRLKLGLQAQERAINEFSSTQCDELLIKEYKRLLNIKQE